MQKLKVEIDGMHCASCASNVEKSLKNLKGVNSVSVSVLTKKAFIETDENIKKDEIKRAIEKVGYKVANIF